MNHLIQMTKDIIFKMIIYYIKDKNELGGFIVMQQQRNQNQRNNQRGNQQQQKKKIPKISAKNANPLGTPTSMQRHALHIFKDIAFQKWDFGVESDIFRYPNFIENAIIAASIELKEAMIHVQAIQTAYAGCSDAAVISLLKKDMRKQQAYQLIYECLNNIKIYGDPSFSLVLVNRLPEYKFDL